MALNDTFTNAARMMFRDVKEDFAIAMNPFKKIFNTVPNTKANQFIDFIDTIKTSDLDGSTEAKTLNLGSRAGTNTPDSSGGVTNQTARPFDDRYRRNRATPEAVQLQWKRRSSDGIGRQLHLSIPRADAQITGHGLDQVMAKYRKRLNQKFNEFYLDMYIELLTASVRENPRIAGYGANAGLGDTVAFKPRYRHILAGKSNSAHTAFSAPFDAHAFFYMTSSLQNSVYSTETEQSLNQGTGIDIGSKNKCTIVISNTGYANWKYTNRETIGHRDYMGKGIVLGAEVHEFQNYRFLCLPDEKMPAVKQTINNAGTFASAVTFPNPKLWDQQPSLLLGARKSTSNAYGNGGTTAGYANANGLHQAIIFDPRAFLFFEPSSLGVELKEYEDFNKTFEKFFYKQVHLESIRVWDPLVRVLYYTMRDVQSGVSVNGSSSSSAVASTDTQVTDDFKVD